MSSEESSILASIKRGGWQGSLITTFNATIPFYEEVILRKLSAVGCRNNVVLMDRRQCALAYQSSATRPRLAGIAYTLIPVEVRGAFHPKLCLLTGKKQASMFVGSHNLTISGFGYNREVTSHVHMLGAPGGPDRALLTQAWLSVRGWLSELGQGLPSSLLASAYSLDDVFGTIQNDNDTSDTALITQRPGGIGLMEQLASRISGNVRRITVVGAFFDRDCRFLRDLTKRWPDAEIIVGIEPKTVWMQGAPSDDRIRLVDAANFGNHKKPGYLHAKAIYFQLRGGENLLAVGSANPSAPAWTTGGGLANVEAMLLRTGAEATSNARALGMDRLAKNSPVSKRALLEIRDRSINLDTPNEAAFVPLYIGVADHNAKLVAFEKVGMPEFDRVEALDEHDEKIDGLEGLVITALGISVPVRLVNVRTFKLYAADAIVARILVHHARIIAERVNGAAREPVNDLLRRLGSDMEDISRLLPHLEKMIFSDSVSSSVQIPRNSIKKGEELGESSPRPESLGVSFSSLRHHNRPTLFSASHDLAYFIDILMRRIGEQFEAGDRGVDSLGRSEEEQVGTDDEDAEEVPAARVVRDATDTEIASAVRNKVSKLVRRMSKALEAGESSTTGTMTKVVQLVAVLALLRELAHLELATRWRKAHTALVWFEDMELLLDSAANTLLANGSMALRVLSEDGEQSADEVNSLRQLLVWLAWSTQLEWRTPNERSVDTEELEARAVTNGKLLELLPHMAGSPEQWAAVRSSIGLTMQLAPNAALSAERWLATHAGVAEKLSRLNHNTALHDVANSSVIAGDVISVPGVIDGLSVAVANDGQYVSVHVGGCQPRRFSLDRVRKVSRV